MKERWSRVTRQMRNEKGFTLIELMGVLAILAIILLIAVPAIGTIIEKSKASSDDSSIKLMERAGELAYIDKLEFDATPGIVPEAESYAIPTLIEEGYLKLDINSKFNLPTNYVTKVNASGEFVFNGEARDGETPEPDGGFIVEIDPITSCEEALAAGYDNCITTPEELVAIGDAPDDKHIIMDDIVIPPGWSPLTPGGADGTFGGELDGNGHDIIGLDNPLIGVIVGGVVENVRLVDVAIDGDGYVGGVAGENYGGTVDNVVATGDVESEGDHAGGLIGFAEGNVLNSCFSGTVTSAGGNVGGLLGTSHGFVENSCSNATVVADGSNIGGLIGDGGTSGGGNNYATGIVTGAGDNVGGLIGTNMYELPTSYATGNVVGGANFTGGLVGTNNGTVDAVYASGSVSSVGAHTGGLIGRSNGQVSSSYALGNVYAEGNRVGGLIGHMTRNTQNVFASGAVDANGESVGGLIGENAGPLQDGYATGDVNGNSYTGGLIGRNNGTMSVSEDGAIYATGDVVSAGNFVGGLFGHSTYSAAPSSYASGDVTGGSHVGGLIGQSYNSESNLSASGTVTGSGAYVGGLIGDHYGDLEESAFTGSLFAGGNYAGGLVGETKGSIRNSYVVATIESDGDYVGGIAGMAGFDITQSYMSGAVSGGANTGALYGVMSPYAGSAVYDTSYWNTDFGGSSAVGNGRTTEQLQQQATYAGWDFDSLWTIDAGNGFPTHQ